MRIILRKKFWARVLLEKNLNHVSLRATIIQVKDAMASIKAAQSQTRPEQTNALIFDIIKEIAQKRKSRKLSENRVFYESIFSKTSRDFYFYIHSSKLQKFYG